MIFFAFLATVALAGASNCPEACPEILDTVCGIDAVTGAQTTFANKCLLRAQNCHEGTNYYVQYMGACTSNGGQNNNNNNNCGEICPEIYKAVCGLDAQTGATKTFANTCLLGQENCRQGTNYYVRSLGPCPEAGALMKNGDQNDCSEVCSELFKPVCGLDRNTGELETFKNPCLMRSKNCLEKTNYYVRYQGACPTPSSTDDDCPLFCPLISVPLCAHDPSTNTRKTFDNGCLLRQANCLQGTNYVEKSWGACPTNEQ